MADFKLYTLKNGIPQGIADTDSGHINSIKIGTSSANTELTKALLDKLASISAGTFFSADMTVSGSGAVTIANSAITNAKIASGAIDNSKIASDAAIVYSKLNIADGDLSIAKTSGLQTALDAKIPLTQKGANSGVATLDAGGKIPVSQLPASVFQYEGTWDASSNTPALSDSDTGKAGFFYIVSVGGTVNFGHGAFIFQAGDWVVNNGTIWQQSHNGNNVDSVNGYTGIVTLTTSDIAEGTHLYYTDARAKAAAVENSIDASHTDIAPSGFAVSGAIDTVNSAIALKADDNAVVKSVNGVGVTQSSDAHDSVSVYVPGARIIGTSGSAYPSSYVGKTLTMTSGDKSGQSKTITSLYEDLGNGYYGFNLSSVWSGGGNIQVGDTFDIINAIAGNNGDVVITTSDIAEGTHLYYTTARVNSDFDTRLATKSTSNLAEGTNLYYTDARANSAFDTRLATKSTSNLAEGTNLYYTQGRFDSAFSAKSTSDLSEGTRLYFTDARAKAAAVADSITDGVTDVAPSQNAVYDALALKANDSAVVKTVNSKSPTAGAVTIGTDDVSEGSTNIYFTDSRARSAAVENSITSGHTTIAPSGDAVYQALLNKQDKGSGLGLTKVAGFNGSANTVYAVRMSINGESAGRIYPARATDLELSYCIGFVYSASSFSTGDSVSVITSGEVSVDNNFSAAQIGLPVYLSETDGQVVVTPVSTEGYWSRQLGVITVTGSGSSKIFIQIGPVFGV